jgi:hypothetical protein
MARKKTRKTGKKPAVKKRSSVKKRTTLKKRPGVKRQKPAPVFTKLITPESPAPAAPAPEIRIVETETEIVRTIIRPPL